MLVLHKADFTNRENFGYFLKERTLTGKAVEIGTHRGEFASQLLSQWGGYLWCVDPYLSGYNADDPVSAGNRHEDYLKALSTLIPYERRTQFRKESSAKAVEGFEDCSLD